MITGPPGRGPARSGTLDATLMTTLRASFLGLPAVERGPDNPLPAFRVADPNGRVAWAESVPGPDRARLGWETAFRALPYPVQDGYTRVLRPAQVPSLVLENEVLTATVLPGWGGRLWSLVHKPSGRELLHRNPVLQLGNLALCNAWFAGGVEWNLPQFGHHPLTCSPLFAGEIPGTEGEPALRLWEFERMKRLVWHVDLHLPPGSPCLFAHVRVVNLNAREVPMYWWSNIAVPEAPDVRVLVPAAGVLTHVTGGQLGLEPLPVVEGRDMTYAARSRRAMEGYFHLDACRPWVAALDGRGRGLFQCSTARLRGRKMFAWGQDPNGRHWQELLSGPGSAYLEIQAGLCRTQLESIPMPASATWSWTEAYGLLEADPALVHGADWDAARGAAAAALESVLPEATVEAWDMKFESGRHHPPVKVLSSGSGWGALERLRMEAAGEAMPEGFVFPESTLDEPQQPWVALLRRGAFPATAEPGAWMTQPEWEDRLAAAPATWQTWLHRGVMRLEQLDPAGAREAWEKSIALQPSCWAYRNLAVLAQREKRGDAALELLARAWPLTPPAARFAMARERLEALNAAGRHADALAFAGELDEAILARDRIRLLRARAAVETGALELAASLLDREFADIREGNAEPTALWIELAARRIAAREGIAADGALRERARRESPPPPHLTFGSSDSSAAYGL